MKRFYTYPSEQANWKWVMRNIKQKPQSRAVHEIVDIGVYDLIKYPYNHSKDKISKWKKLKTKGWKVVPDVPDMKGEFKVKTNNDNIEMSWDYLINLYNPNNIHHLPVIQSRFKDVTSLENYCINFIKEYGQVSKIGVGTICKLPNIKIVTEMLQLIRKYFPETWIHAFGLQFPHLRRNYNIIDSYDTTAWTFPRTPNRPSCGVHNRIDYFWEYIIKLEELGYKVNQWRI